MNRLAGIGILGLLLLTACEENIDLISQSDPTPVIHCILDTESDVQTLRLSRSYITQNATIPPNSSDSLLLAEPLDVIIEQVADEEVVAAFAFEPVHFLKDSGFFPTEEHWVYQAHFRAHPETTYRLIVYLERQDQLAYATCTTLSQFRIINPVYPAVRSIHFQTDHNPFFTFTKSQHAGIYQMGYILHFEESQGTELRRDSLVLFMNTLYGIEATENLFNQGINSNQFYARIGENLTADPQVFRKFLALDVFVLGGGEELAYLMRLQEFGQTFALMEYSNIQNGIGVFSSRYTQYIRGFQITGQSIDSLAYGRFTDALNFADRTGTRSGGGK